jgi:hypothetical protein
MIADPALIPINILACIVSTLLKWDSDIYFHVRNTTLSALAFCNVGEKLMEWL